MGSLIDLGIISNPAFSVCVSHCVHACKCSFTKELSTSYPSYCLKRILKKLFSETEPWKNWLHQARSMNSRIVPTREFQYLRSDCKCFSGNQQMTDHWSQWKANVALGIQFVVQLRLFSPTLTPRLPCSLLPLRQLTSPFLSQDTELSSHFHLALCSLDGRMLGRTDRGEQTWLDKLLDHHSPTLSPLHSPLSLFHFPCHPFISFDLSSTPLPLLLSLLSLCSCFLSLYHLWLTCRQCCGIGSSMGLDESSGTKQS